MGKWISQLSKFQGPTRKQVPKVPEASFGTSDTALGQECPKIEGLLNAANQLHQTIQSASEEELEHLHDRATAAWNNGAIDRDIAETLTRLVWNRSRQLQRIAKPQQNEPLPDAT